MELHFTPEQEAHLQQLALYQGKSAEEWIIEAVQHRAAEDSVFREGVRRGLDQANAGDFIAEDEMEARIRKMMQS